MKIRFLIGLAGAALLAGCGQGGYEPTGSDFAAEEAIADASVERLEAVAQGVHGREPNARVIKPTATRRPPGLEICLRKNGCG